ncbi:hypothetical protein P3W85_30060 [Cupriavidus basilensis]|uniref:Uncharacterized protein n=1 Tax=Cupriavidus basilensis TaxID=68895 RepID=A0ABT6AX06_9BURK|nr:hypothetical protein [Cupriavidus basilensis]MDF3837169.1 hypothetical protein [Cupriavidus basilensis]
MPTARKDAHNDTQTVTTPEGLTALLQHLVHVTSQGQLDPELVRKLGKRLIKEAEVLTQAGGLNDDQLSDLDEALARLDQMINYSGGCLLSKAASRLRETDTSSAPVNLNS